MIRFAPVVALVACLVTEAQAQDVFADDVLEILPVGTLSGDGSTPVTLRVFARKADGSAWTGLSAKVTSSKGQVGRLQPAGEGWYSFTFTPPSDATSARLTVKAGGTSTTRTVRVRPVVTGSIDIEAPPTIVLGRNDSATVRLTVPGGGPVEVSASAGTLKDLTDMGGGSFSARYTPPKVNYPHLAQITAVSKDHPSVRGTGVIRLQGAVDFPVQADAGSSVVLEIEGKDYGPVRMDDTGSGKVPIIVSPGVNTATKKVIEDGKTDASPFNLQIPETRRIAFAPMVGGIPLNGKAHPVLIMVSAPDGGPAADATIQVTASAGSVTPARHVGDGLYQVDYTPEGPGNVKLTARIPGAKKSETTLDASVLPSLSDNVSWSSLSSVPVSRTSVADVVLVPKTRVLATGGSKSAVFVAAVDRAGYPVPGTTIELSTTAGNVQNTITTNTTGIATVEWTSPNEPQFGVLSATVGGVGTETGIIAAAAPIDVQWPKSPGVQGAWEARLPSESVAVASATPAPVTSAPEPASPAPTPKAGGEGDAEVTSVALVELPSAVAPGSTITVKARAEAGSGIGVAGQSLDFMTNTGSFGDVRDAGDGNYEAELTVPKKATGELKLSVVADSGVLGRGSLGIDPSAMTAKSDTIKRRPPKEPSDQPKLRVRAGGAGGIYNYAQRPSDTPGPLLPGSLVVGGPDGGRSATLAGAEADLRAWFLPYVGTHLAFRGTSYSISAEAFSDPAPDWLYHVRGDLNLRFPFDVGNDQFWIGASGGFQLDDFMVFRGCLEAGCDVFYEPLVLPGVEVGGEIGAELGPVFLIANVSRGFANARVGYRTSVDADFGIEVTDNVFVDLGGAFVARRLPVEGSTTGAPLGELDDTQMVGRLSLGLQF